MPQTHKRRASNMDATPPTASQSKKTKTTREKAETPSAPPSAGPSTNSPSRKRGGGATFPVIWIRNPPSKMIPVKDQPWMLKEVYGLYEQIKVACPSTNDMANFTG